MIYAVNYLDKLFKIEEELLFDFIKSIKKEEIYNILKIRIPEKNIILYDFEFPDTDYIGNYKTLPEIYGINCLSEIDIQVINYMQSN